MKQWPADPRTTRVFHFGRCAYNQETGELSLAYRLDDSPELVERLVFPGAPWPVDARQQAAFEQALQLLHLIAGVSYYKAALAPQVRFSGPAPVPAVAEFITDLYVRGLAEFSYVNKVNVADQLHLPTQPDTGDVSQELVLPNRALVAMGGGKDSLVGLDLMRRAGVEVLPVCIGSSPLIAETVAASALPLLRIERHLAPGLARLNQSGAWNGHIPVTAINSAILACAALLYGYRYVVFSNERSANEATLISPDGTPVNHQFSKTSEFELAFRGALQAHVSPNLEYFSILRPFSELDIVRRFCALTAFHGVYSSCNRNFHLGGSVIAGRWCGDCPKCRFAALSLAVFLPPASVQTIMGADLLNEPQQEEGFRAICALGRDKPFECVGEAGESRAALAAIAQRAEWRHHRVVEKLLPELGQVEVPALASLLKPSLAHCIPRQITAALPEEFS